MRLAAALLLVLVLGCSSPSPGGAGAGGSGGEDAAAGAGGEAGGAAGGEGGCGAGFVPEPGVVLTTEGPVRGRLDGDAYAFLGIPYAAPPMGPRRFRPPEPAACRGRILEARGFGPACPQHAEDLSVTGDEDCLTLNVWAPASLASVLRPVVVFVHGGGNVQGSASEAAADGTVLHDGARLAVRGDAVVVTLQYRLGILGWLVHPALGGDAGNCGLLDQLAALRWVRGNAAAFGGDPDRVVVIGASAGGSDVCALVTSPASAGLFRAAAMLSGGCVVASATAMELEGRAIAVDAGCEDAADPAACLRELPAEELLGAHPVRANGLVSTPLGPHVDGTILPAQPLLRLSARAVPLVIGATADETARMVPEIPSVAAYEAAVRQLYPAAADRLLALYPADAFPTPRQAMIRLTTDVRFVCPARRWARQASGAPVPAYRTFLGRGLHGASAVFGAFHGLDGLLLFDLGHRIAGFEPDAAEEAITSALIDGVVGLARDGVPAGTVPWPAYESLADPFLDLGEPVAAGAGVRTAACDAIDRL